MNNLKKVMLNVFLIAFITTPVMLYAQDKEKQMNKDPHDDYTNEEINAELAKLDQEPGDDLEREFQAIAESRARDLQTKLNFDDDTFEDIKEVIVGYLDDRWETRIELAQERNDQEEVKESAADLAYLRVNLVDEITDELDDGDEKMWDTHAVDFWLSLDKAIFDLKIEKIGIALEKISDDQRN